MRTRSNRSRRLFPALLLIGLLGCASHPPTSSPTPSAGLDVSDLDPGTSASRDLYGYANGGWLKAHPLPEGGNIVTRMGEDQPRLYQLLQALATRPGLRGEEKMLAEFFRSGMDVERVERLGVEPLDDLLTGIDAIADARSLQAMVEHLHRFGIGAYFRLGATPRLDGSLMMIAELHQADLGLATPQAYLASTPQAEAWRKAYRGYLSRLLVLSGWSVAASERGAGQVLALETRLAAVSLDPASLRDPRRTYHPQEVSRLSSGPRHWSWPAYFRAFGLDKETQVNVTSASYFSTLEREWALTELAAHKAYLRVCLLQEMSDALSSPFTAARRALRADAGAGGESASGRGGQVTAMLNRKMGMALGRVYVREFFRKSDGEKAGRLVVSIREQLVRELGAAEGLNAAERKEALARLEAMKLQLWYPEPWPRTDVSIEEGQPYARLVLAANESLVRQELARIGHKESGHWPFPPQTGNAQYSASTNTLTLPAGLLRSPFFREDYDPATSYGRLGFLVAHELMHVFDDAGAEFDASGRLRARSAKDPEAVVEALLGGSLEKASPLARGECMADRAGLLLAYRAFRANAPSLPRRDGLSPEQRFFVSFAQLWAANVRPGYQVWRSQRDPHPPPAERVNGSVAALEEFRRAFPAADAPRK